MIAHTFKWITSALEVMLMAHTHCNIGVYTIHNMILTRLLIIEVITQSKTIPLPPPPPDTPPDQKRFI